ncbi:uncharacterized membrane protein YidH (DUF202 family) [Nocardia transvalensis]|uniref:Uncharacterized membrane protein YidH (DUF202 family) n=1 Tax=Nocardia transvalensis TaxID=37333 RepID=A0A7W9UGA9_9NOCA|nr:DUF202 domain-containing protein [Nocardia transvalensis]MBB5912093.1 uncharacterized membrane protein YidH (DUF202 family) [Nocardia transvalensis]
MTAPTLAAERTALAWRRTAVAAMATAALFIHEAIGSGWRETAAAPVAAALVLMAVTVMSYVRNRSLQQGHWGHGSQVIAVTAVAIIGVALAAVAIGATDPLF